jgi:hypothetical protein
VEGSRTDEQYKMEIALIDDTLEFPKELLETLKEKLNGK